MKRATSARPDELSTFVISVFVFSWLLWLPGVLITQLRLSVTDASVQLVNLFSILGGVGPTAVGLFLLYRKGRWRLVKSTLLRCFRFRIGRWIVPALLLMPVTLLLAHLANGLLFGSRFPRTSLLQAPWWIPAVFIVFYVLAMSEEIGWRGVALASLQDRFHAVTSSVIIGVIWACWHIPMFLSAGFGHHDKRLPFVQFFATLVLASIIITWLQNNGRQSLVPALSIHAFINMSGEILPVSTTNPDGTIDNQPWLLLNALLLLISVCIVVRFGYRNLSRAEKR